MTTSKNKFPEPKVGEWRWIAGQGYMKIESFHDGHTQVDRFSDQLTSVKCVTLSGSAYWAGPNQVRGLPELEGLRNYLQSGVPRGVFKAIDLLPLFEVIDQAELVVECTQCGAEPGDKCRWPVGGRECTQPHLPRRIAVKEKK
jgi:hypothetical protein